MKYVTLLTFDNLRDILRNIDIVAKKIAFIMQSSRSTCGSVLKQQHYWCEWCDCFSVYE